MTSDQSQQTDILCRPAGLAPSQSTGYNGTEGAPHLGSGLFSRTEDLSGLPDTFLDLDLARGMKTGTFFLSLLRLTRGLEGRLPEIIRR